MEKESFFPVKGDVTDFVIVEQLHKTACMVFFISHNTKYGFYNVYF